MKHYRPINIWILQMVFLSFGGYYLWKNGIFTTILLADPTYISFIVMFIFACVSLSIGYKTIKFSKTGTIQPIEFEWFFRNELASFGLIGTIIGMMLILGPAFGAIDPAVGATISSAIASISIGIGTALWTTITALISAVLIGLQLVNLEHAQKNETI